MLSIPLRRELNSRLPRSGKVIMRRRISNSPFLYVPAQVRGEYFYQLPSSALGCRKMHFHTLHKPENSKIYVYHSGADTSQNIRLKIKVEMHGGSYIMN